VYNKKVRNDSAAEPQTEQPVSTKALQEIRTKRLRAAIVVLLETRYEQLRNACGADPASHVPTHRRCQLNNFSQ
jgi:hypothetical protein